MRSPEQFARAVDTLANVVEIVFMGEDGFNHPMLVWPEMGDPAWRDAALVLVKANGRVEEAQFCEPNPKNNWTFKAKRKGSAVALAFN